MDGGGSRSVDTDDRASGGASLIRVVGMPLALAAVSALGLVSALLGDGLWDWLSWFALALPVAVTIRFLARELGLRAKARRR